MSSSINPPITTLITITIVTNPRNWLCKIVEVLQRLFWIFNYDIKMTITCKSSSSNETFTSVGNCNCYEIVIVITGHRVVQFSLNILVINKSDSRCAVVRFCKSLVWLQTELDSTQSYLACENSRPSTLLGPGGKKDGCFRRLSPITITVFRRAFTVGKLGVYCVSWTNTKRYIFRYL